MKANILKLLFALVLLAGVHQTSWAQNIFVSDNTSQIYEVTPGGVVTTFASGLQTPAGLAFDRAGNLYEADGGSGNIYEFTNNAGVLSTNAITYASGLAGATGMAFNSAGILFVGVFNVIVEISTNGSTSTLGSVPTVPQSLAFDSAGNLYVADSGTYGHFPASILEFTNNAGTLSTSYIALSTNLDYPVGLAFAANGNLFEAEGNDNDIFEFTNNAGTLSPNYFTFTDGLNRPQGLAFDSAGDLFEADFGTSMVYEFTNNAGTLSSSPVAFASGLVNAYFIAIFPMAPPPPALGISTYGGQPAVFFPTASGTNYVLQLTTNLTSGNWVTVSNGYAISGIVITNPPASAFFRLH